VLTTLATVLTALVVTAGAALGSTPGVDVASYQHNPSIDWQQVHASGVKFAFIKATEGTGYVNPYLTADLSGTQQAGIYRGVYHFARPDASTGDAANEARYFVAHAGPTSGPGVLPPVLDLEVTGGLGVSALQAWVSAWLQTVEKLTGRAPIIYVSPYFWQHSMGDSTAFHHYPLWIANYGVTSPTVPGGWPTWTFWQGSSTGQVQGISGSTDTDAFNGSLDRLQVLAGISSTTPSPAPSPAPAPAPKAPTALTATLSSTSVRQGRSVTISGTVATDEAQPLAGRILRVEQRPTGTSTWTTLTSTTSGADGSYTATVPVTGNVDLRVIAQHTDAYVRAISSTMTVTCWVPTPTTLTLAARRPLTTAGARDRLTGALTRTDTGAGLSSRVVTLWQRAAGTSTWQPAGQASTATDGAFHFVVRPVHSTYYRARFAGAPHYLRAHSSLDRVTVG
jgi:GH25 family lysozyme M1 (1,4-beta-N-acetylmuramidase)